MNLPLPLIPLSHIKDELGDILVKKLNSDIARTFFRDLYNKTSAHAYNHCLKFLKRAFNYAIEIDKITTNPFDKVKPLKIQKVHRERFPIEELKKIIDNCITEIPEYYCIFILSVLTGMREGEYSALRPCDIKKKGNHYAAIVNKQITRNELKDRTKTPTSTRMVDLSDKVYDIIHRDYAASSLKALLPLCLMPINFC